MARLASRDGFDDDLAEAIVAAQLPILEKLPRADVVFWNEGPEEVLRRQISRFLQTLDLDLDHMSEDKKSAKKTAAEEQPAGAEAEGAEQAKADAAVETAAPPRPNRNRNRSTRCPSRSTSTSFANAPSPSC